MKSRFTKIVLAASLLSMPALAVADEYTSLVGVEGGYSNVDAQSMTGTTTRTIQDSGFGDFGVKIGAESKDWRIFVGARYYDAKDFSKLNTIGLEGQYIFNFAKEANFFVGGNVGKAYMRVSDGVNPAVSTNSTYYGADAGFNFHATELVDLELGARYMRLSESVIQGGTTYEINSIATAYASVILKFQID
jgi:hypothetical protein